MTENPQPSELEQLIDTVARLRAPGGCAWDGEQTHESLVQYLLEESHELAEAIEQGSREDLLEELGDVLYQVLFHADIAAHTAGEDFDLQDVARATRLKMVGRHPHVFGEREAATAEEVVALWDDVKAAEKSERTSVLDGIPMAMPSLLLADKLLGRAQKVGVLEELPKAVDVQDEAELGPLLLAIVASAKANGLDAERALRTALRGLTDEIREAEGTAQPPAAAHGVDAADAGIIGRIG